MQEREGIAMAKRSPSTENRSFECFRDPAQAAGHPLQNNERGLFVEQTAASENSEGFFYLYGRLRDIDLACPSDDVPAPLEPLV